MTQSMFENVDQIVSFSITFLVSAYVQLTNKLSFLFVSDILYISLISEVLSHHSLQDLNR